MESTANWIVGGICRNDKKAFMTRVRNRQMETIDSIVLKHIAPLTILLTDSAKVYKNLEKRVAMHGLVIFVDQVNHKKEFVRKDNRMIHTNTVERMWGDFKNNLASTQSLSGIDLYIAEYLFRKEFLTGDDAKNLEVFLRVCGEVYPGPDLQPMAWKKVYDVVGEPDIDFEGMDVCEFVNPEDEMGIVEQMAHFPQNEIDVHTTRNVAEGFPGLYDSLLDDSHEMTWGPKNIADLKEPFKYVQWQTNVIEKESLNKTRFSGNGPYGYLDDSVIKCYLDIVASSFDNVSVIDPLLLAGQVELVAASPGAGVDWLVQRVDNFDINTQALVLFPVHLPGHWTLFAYLPGTQQLNYYDSFNAAAPAIHAEVVAAFIVAKSAGLQNLLVKRVKVPSQNNSNDCGVYVCAYAEVLARQLDMYEQIVRIRSVSHLRTMSVFREKIVHHILLLGAAGYDDIPAAIPGEVMEVDPQ